MQKNPIRTKLQLFILFSAISLLPLTTLGAGFHYESATVLGQGQIMVRSGALEAKNYYKCELGAWSCAAIPESIPAYVPPALSGKHYFLNAAGDRVLIRENGVNNYYAFANGELSWLKKLPFTDSVRTLKFSTDGKRLAVVTGEGAALQIDLAANKVVSRFTVPDRMLFLALSPDANFLVYYTNSNLKSDVRKHVVWNIAKKKSYTLSVKTAYWDLLEEEARLYQFTPDGKKLIYLSDHNGYPVLYSATLANLSGKTLGGTQLIRKPYNVGDFLVWDNKTIYFMANRDNPLIWSMYSFTVAGDNLKKIADYASYGNTIGRSGDFLLFNRTGKSGSEVYAYEPKTGIMRNLLGWDIEAAYRGDPVKLGKTYGVLLKPDNYDAKKTYPVLIWLHGGPYRQSSIGYNALASYGTYDWILENLRESGVVVLKLDYTGSYGYGRKFAEALKGNVGKQDVTDVLSALTLLKQKMKLGPAYLSGNSYGGYLALRALVEKPAAFAGAESINGVTDWKDLLTAIPDSIFTVHFGGAPAAKNAKLYDQASVVDRIGKLSDQRILIIQGDSDTTIPKIQAEAMFANLKEVGYGNTELVMYSGENHVYAKSSTIEDLCRQTYGLLGMNIGDKCVLPL